MKLFSFLLIINFIWLISFESAGQETTLPISKIENLDKKLIGRKLKTAIKILELDTNFRVISEPPGKYRGVCSSEIEGWQVQLIVRKSLVNKKIKAKGVYAGICNKRIIGISWMSPNKCNSVGQVIQHYTYNRFGPC